MNDLTCSSLTVEYWPSVIIVWTLLHCHVCIATTFCQYNSDVPHAWLILEIIILQPSEEQEMFTDLFLFFSPCLMNPPLALLAWRLLIWRQSLVDRCHGGQRKKMMMTGKKLRLFDKVGWNQKLPNWGKESQSQRQQIMYDESETSCFWLVFFLVYKAQSTFHSNFLLFITAKPNLQTCLCKFYTITKCPALLATRYWSTCSSIMVLRQKRQHKMLLDSKDSHVLLTIIKIYLK